MTQHFYTHYTHTVNKCAKCGKAAEIIIQEEKRPIDDEILLDPFTAWNKRNKEIEEQVIKLGGLCECPKKAEEQQ